jgi:hypothetical protein
MLRALCTLTAMLAESEQFYGMCIITELDKY